MQKKRRTETSGVLGVASVRADLCVCWCILKCKLDRILSQIEGISIDGTWMSQHLIPGNSRIVSNQILVPQMKLCDIHNIHMFLWRAGYFSRTWSLHFCEHPYKFDREEMNWIQNETTWWDCYQVQKLKRLEMRGGGSEMKRESNLGTGWWFGIQQIGAKLVWTALCMTQRNQFKNTSCIFDSQLLWWYGHAHGVQTNVALITGKTREGIHKLGPTPLPTNTSHPG